MYNSLKIAAKKRTKPKQDADPYWLAAPGAAGLLGLGLAHGISSSDQAATLKDVASRFDTPFQPNETPLSRYVEVMSQMANTRPFGTPVGEILAKVRASPEIMGALGADPDYLTNRPGSFQEARAHYSAFSKGPIAALYHMMQPKARGNTPVPGNLLPAPVGGGPMRDGTIQSTFGPTFSKTWDEFVARKLPGASGWLSPLEIDLETVPHAQQLEFFHDYNKNLEAAGLQAARQKVEKDMGDSLGRNVSNYLPKAKAILKLRDMAEGVGMAGAGAAVGGLGGYALSRLNRRKGDKYVPIINPTLATVGGAGIGGTMSFLLGSAQGRSLLSSLVTKKQANKKQAALPANLLKLLLGSAAVGGAAVGGRRIYTDIADTKSKLDGLLDQAGNTAASTNEMINKVQPHIQETVEGINKAQRTADQRTALIGPVLGGFAGAGIGHLLGSLQERAGEQDLEEQRKQKRNRILLTLLGGAGGVYAGVRTAQGKQANQQGFDKLLALAPDADTAAALKQLEFQNPAQLRADLTLPALTRLIGYPVGGAALGATAGGLIQALRGRDKEDQDKPSVGRGALLGGLAGGLLGTGVIPDIPRQVYNSSPYGRALGKIPFADGLKTYLRLLTRDGADEAIPDAMNAAYLKKWGPALPKL